MPHAWLPMVFSDKNDIQLFAEPLQLNPYLGVIQDYTNEDSEQNSEIKVQGFKIKGLLDSEERR